MYVEKKPDRKKKKSMFKIVFEAFNRAKIDCFIE